MALPVGSLFTADSLRASPAASGRASMAASRPSSPVSAARPVQATHLTLVAAGDKLASAVPPPAPHAALRQEQVAPEFTFLEQMEEQCERLQTIHKELQQQDRLQDLMEQQCQRLEETIEKKLQQRFGEGGAQALMEQQCQRLEDSFKRHMEQSMSVAALYFIQCQEAKNLGRELPDPQIALDATLSETICAMNGRETASSTKSPSFDALTRKSPSFDALTSTKPLEETDVPGTEVMDMCMASQAQNGEPIAKKVDSSLWEVGEIEKLETGHSWFRLAFERGTAEKIKLHTIWVKLGFHLLIPDTRPDNFLVRFVDQPWFHGFSTMAIILNTLFDAYESDSSIRMLLKEPPESLPVWWDHVNFGFSVFFLLELILRFMAFRAFFFVDRSQAIWNLLDVAVCSISLTAMSVDIMFIRVLRIFRLVRVLHVLVNSQALVSLRNLLFAVAACIVPLIWALVFLLMTMFLFALLILKYLSSAMLDSDYDHAFSDEVRKYFYGFDGCMKTLFIIVGGPDWVGPHSTLQTLTGLFALIMPLFVAFVNIGIMNIVVGVFADAAAGTKDRHSISEEEIGNLENFVVEMVELVSDEVSKDGTLEWDRFKVLFYREDVQAYLYSHGIDASHVQLLYRLFDCSKDNTVDLREFVIGMLRLRGSAKCLEGRVMLRAVKVLIKDVECIRHEIEHIRGGIRANVQL